MLRVKIFIEGNRVGVFALGTTAEVSEGETATRVEIEAITEARKDGYKMEQPDSSDNRAWFCDIGMLGKSGDGYYALVSADCVEVLGVAASKDQISLFGE